MKVHNQLTRGPWSAAVKAALGDSKGESGIERFGETLDPIINLWGMPEWALLRQEFLFADQHTQALLAGEFSWIALVNPAPPAGSKQELLVVLESARFVGGAGMAYNLATMLAGDVAATLALIKRVSLSDLRTAVSGSAVQRGRAEIWAGNDPANTGNIFEQSETATSYQAVNLPIIIAPGFAVVFQGNTVATLLRVNFSGRERLAFPGEQLRR